MPLEWNPGEDTDARHRELSKLDLWLGGWPREHAAGTDAELGRFLAGGSASP